MTMILVDVSKLEGSALDWAVATAAGAYGVATGTDDLLGNKIWAVPGFSNMRWDDWTPSTDWSQGGPLIDLHIEQVEKMSGANPVRAWCADTAKDERYMFGPTLLVAACRAIVAAKLGEVVEIPAELVGVQP